MSYIAHIRLNALGVRSACILNHNGPAGLPSAAAMKLMIVVQTVHAILKHETMCRKQTAASRGSLWTYQKCEKKRWATFIRISAILDRNVRHDPATGYAKPSVVAKTAHMPSAGFFDYCLTRDRLSLALCRHAHIYLRRGCGSRSALLCVYWDRKKLANHP